MTLESAQRIIRALADGINPQTGEELALDSVMESPNVIRALHVAATALDVQLSREARRDRPDNAGKSWDSALDKALAELFDSGRSVTHMAKQLGRTNEAIAARLVRIGKIADRGSAYRVAGTR